jgi:hypothetical protein
MPFPNFHTARINDPDQYTKKRYARDEFGQGVDVIYGITSEGKAEVQSVRFSKDKFTVEQARAWLKKHPEHKVISFEPATAVKTQMQKVSDPYDHFQRTLWDLSNDVPGYAKVHYCPECRLNKSESHDAILQGLDRKVGSLIFGKENFIPTVDYWNSRPIIFSKLHPDPVAFDEDPEKELMRIHGGITGELSNAAIENIVGEPRLNVRKNYNDEVALRFYDAGLISVDSLNRSYDAIPATLALIAQNKLAHSSAFICPDDGERLFGIVKPHHVLDFERTPKDQPVDPVSIILNKENENVTKDDAQLQIGKVISAKNASKIMQAFDALKKFVDEVIHGTGDEDQTITPPIPAEVQMNKTEGGMNEQDGEPLTVKKKVVLPIQENKMTPEDQKKMDEKDAEIAALKAKIAELEGKSSKTQKEVEDMQAALKAHEDAKVQAQKAKFDADWANLEKTVIPPAEVKDPADKAKLQKMSMDEPLVFAAKIAEWRKANPLKQEGTVHSQKAGDDTESERNRILSTVNTKIPGQFH